MVRPNLPTSSFIKGSGLIISLWSVILITSLKQSNYSLKLAFRRSSRSNSSVFLRTASFVPLSRDILKQVGIDVQFEPVQQISLQASIQGGRWENLLLSNVGANADVAMVITVQFSGDGKNYAM